MNLRTLRINMKGKIFTDKVRRIVAGQHEILRNTLRFITHTESIPLQTRYIAQFQLSSLPKSTNLNHITRRCVLTGRGKSVIREFNLCRHAFRKLALNGQISGVTKAIW